MNRLLSPGRLLAKTFAAIAIAVFWCVSAVEQPSVPQPSA